MWCRSSVGVSDQFERSAASSSTSLRARRRRRAWLCLCETAASRHNDEDRGLGGHSDRETQRGSDVPPPTRAAGPWRTQNLLSALSSTAARAGLRRRLRARRTITPHRCEAPSLSAGPGPEARARVRRRTSAVDDPGRRRDVARHRRAAPRRRRRARRPQAPHERQRARRVLRERLRVHGARGEAQGPPGPAGPGLHLPALRHDPTLPGDGRDMTTRYLRQGPCRKGVLTSACVIIRVLG